ncbi:type II toxin-antitoxin system PemK/MazF family toxin [Fructobacillus sp. W13]|uniref:Type II toxin-antitoxin system PemK/MazF family toxin n=1 Tax=Fructobacillus apis TaxID=2935017 RepID=A0ABT0ZNE1_9LACO|nr:type II toxin-antitoxin system PemK/MazF family toxin [Fructobacillus apis]MCO0831522.1 type II toxin-antitoxin system PemK/MazF family toxin [Fructobacillus apis]
MYRPKQGNLIWVDFDPALGIEIKKRRPALVISTNYYHGVTKMAILLPITSQLRNWKARFDLKGYQVIGQINTSQIYSFDLSKRHPVYIQTLKKNEFYQVIQMVQQNVDSTLIDKKALRAFFISLDWIAE